jgi:hypothetical protein
MSGVRVRTAELAALGVTLPGFVRRGRVIAQLPSLGLLTVAGLTPPGHEATHLEVDDLESLGVLPEFDLVGISSFTARIEAAYELADRFRARGVPVALVAERFWDQCTLFDVTFVPKRMSVGELEAGLRWLLARLQSFVAQRRDARWARHAATARAGGAPAPADGPAP